MIDASTRVYSNLKKSLSDICSNVVNNYSDDNAIFPTLSVDQIGNGDTANDMENGENAVISEIQLEAYSKDISEAKDISVAASDQMRIMGYQRFYGPQKIENTANTKIYRMIARYRRTVCDLDEIPQYQ